MTAADPATPHASRAGSQGVFAGGAVVLTKKQYIAAVKDLVAACPDFEYSCPTDDWKEEKDQVTATLVVTGTHLSLIHI
eukprot:1755368-Prymnesium_polylepis.1